MHHPMQLDLTPEAGNVIAAAELAEQLACDACTVRQWNLILALRSERCQQVVFWRFSRQSMYVVFQ
jgi:hypothetical protein